MSGSTSIDQLPVSPQTDENVKLETTEINRKIDNPMAELQKQREADMQALAAGAAARAGTPATTRAGSAPPGRDSPSRRVASRGRRMESRTARSNRNTVTILKSHISSVIIFSRAKIGWFFNLRLPSG